MKKLFSLIFGIMVSSAGLFAGNEATAVVMEQSVGMAQTFGFWFVVGMGFIYIVLIVTLTLLAKHFAKKSVEKDQESNGGLVIAGWATGGGIAGFFLAFMIVGAIGDVANPARNNAAKISFMKGNRYIISNTIGSMVAKTSKSLKQ